MQQLKFGFIREIDDRLDGVKRIDGWPVLNWGNARKGLYQSGWIYRCWYPHAEDALVDAKQASDLYPGKRFYVVQFGSQQHDGYIDLSIWPEGRHWAIREEPPFSGTQGAYYYPRLDYYVVLRGTEFLVEGEDMEVIECKKKKAVELWEKQQKSADCAVQRSSG